MWQAAAITSAGLFTPAHTLLGALRVNAITTNYDSLFEASQEASGDGGGVIRLPWDAPKLSSGDEARGSEKQAKLLKLHGCVSRPQSIVLTREDYLRYGDEREALRGLVARSLLEKELLIVGFSMTDDNVHLVIDRCKKVWSGAGGGDGGNDSGGSGSSHSSGSGGHKKMGTILTLVANSMFTRL